MRERLARRAKLSDRVDDNPETIAKRLQSFRENNVPVLEYLQEHGPLHRVSKQANLLIRVDFTLSVRSIAVARLMRFMPQCAALSEKSFSTNTTRDT